MKLPQAFSERMAARLGEEFPAFEHAYSLPPVKGLRVNPLKIASSDFRARAPFPLGEGVPWEENTFLVGEERLGADPYHFAGLYYLQEPSATCAAPLLGVRPGERVLDLCAAPGGKTARLAADLQGEGILIANEIDGTRAKALSQNVERLGICNCAVVSASPERLAELFPNYFDKILVDAPCSGEGMFRKEPAALFHWSEANVRMCAARQKTILESAVKMLSGGGKLVYSVCTFSDEETTFQTSALQRLLTPLGEAFYYPHKIQGEGHFAALFQKEEGERGSARPYRPRHSRGEEVVRAFLEDFLEEQPKGEIALLEDGRAYLIPADTPLLPVRTLRLGVELGEWDGKVFRPAHALAMAFGKHARRKVSLSREDSIPYLRGETVAGEEEGWCVVCVEEFPLGLGKCANGVVKNHLPKGLRLYT